MAKLEFRHSLCRLRWHSVQMGLFFIFVITEIVECVYVTKYTLESNMDELYTHEGHLKTISADKLDCAVQCTNHPLCASFFYSNYRKFCSLHGVDFSSPTAAVFAKNDAKYYRNHCATQGYEFSNITGVFHKIFPHKGSSWEEARQFCDRKGGRLIVLNSVEKVDEFRDILNREIYATMAGVDDDAFWVGARRNEVDDYFLWLNGENVTEGWSPNEPKSKAENTDCVLMNPIHGRLDDFACGHDTRLHPICECPRR